MAREMLSGTTMRSLQLLALLALAASSMTGCYHRARYMYAPGYYGRPAYVQPQRVYVQPQPVYVQPQPVYVQPAGQVIVQPGY